MPFRVKGELIATKRLIAGNALLGNTAIGPLTMNGNPSGNNNIAIGGSALLALTSGTDNIAIGNLALSATTSGTINVAIGNLALQDSAGSANIAIGHQAISASSTGSDNIAIGAQALQNVTSGGSNVTLGLQGLQAVTTGFFNVGVGLGAGDSVSTGFRNTCLGFASGGAISTGANNTCLGADTSVSAGAATGRIAIGINSGGTAANATVDNGLFFHTSIATAAGAAVQYNAGTGQMGPVASSLRFKENVKPIEIDTSKVFALQAVSYNLKPELCGGQAAPREFGFIAEDVAKVFPEVVPLDAEGRPMSINYDRIVVLLLEEMRKTNDELDKLRAEVRGSGTRRRS